MKVTCPNCGKEFEGIITIKNEKWMSSCDDCDLEFDIEFPYDKMLILLYVHEADELNMAPTFKEIRTFDNGNQLIEYMKSDEAKQKIDTENNYAMLIVNGRIVAPIGELSRDIKMIEEYVKSDNYKADEYIFSVTQNIAARKTKFDKDMDKYYHIVDKIQEVIPAVCQTGNVSLDAVSELDHLIEEIITSNFADDIKDKPGFGCLFSAKVLWTSTCDFVLSKVSSEEYAVTHLTACLAAIHTLLTYAGYSYMDGEDPIVSDKEREEIEKNLAEITKNIPTGVDPVIFTDED